MTIDFVGKRKAAFVFSIGLIIVGIVGSIVKGGPNYGVDFTGGILLWVSFREKIGIEEFSRIRASLRDKGLLHGTIQRLGREQNEILIKTRVPQGGAAQEVAGQIESVFEDEIGKFDRVQSDKISPTISREMRRLAILAIVFAILGMLVYIALRFEFRFAVAAIIALVHDVLISTLGLIILNVELDTPIIAGLLTISGYSINDTIVVFDRIRENIRRLRKESYKNLINTSINQVLDRTIITSLTTLFAVLSLYILGGEVIRPFALTLLFGIVIGTYSSIFIASPILIDWPKKSIGQKKDENSPIFRIK